MSELNHDGNDDNHDGDVTLDNDFRRVLMPHMYHNAKSGQVYHTWMMMMMMMSQGWVMMPDLKNYVTDVS